MLDDPEHGQLAAEAVCAITGLSTEDEPYWLDPPALDDTGLPALEHDNLDADLVPEAHEALPHPNPKAIRAWWAQAREGFDVQRRYLGGTVLDGRVIGHALDSGPAWRRHLLAFELEVRTNGQITLDTRAWGWVQREQLREAGPTLARLDFQRSVS